MKLDMFNYLPTRHPYMISDLYNRNIFDRTHSKIIGGGGRVNWVIIGIGEEGTHVCMRDKMGTVDAGQPITCAQKSFLGPYQTTYTDLPDQNWALTLSSHIISQ